MVVGGPQPVEVWRSTPSLNVIKVRSPACLDRVVTTGTLPAIADDGAMAGLLG
jgi:hypothetical protein